MTPYYTRIAHMKETDGFLQMIVYHFILSSSSLKPSFANGSPAVPESEKNNLFCLLQSVNL